MIDNRGVTEAEASDMDPKKGKRMEIWFSFAALFTEHKMTSSTDMLIAYLLVMMSTSAFLAARW